MTIKLVEHYNVFKAIYKDISFETTFKNFDHINANFEFMSLGNTWREDKPEFNSLWLGKIYKPGETAPKKQDKMYGCDHIPG